MVSNQILSFNRSILGNVEIRKEKEFERMKEKSKKKEWKKTRKKEEQERKQLSMLEERLTK